MIEKWDKRFLTLAKLIASWSKDPSTKTGAVIVSPDRSIISCGYNGFARGVEDDPVRYADRDLKYKLVVHAERNAIIFAQKSIREATIYVWPWMPCAPCAGMVIQSGIERCVSLINLNPRWQEDFDLTKMMFKEAEVRLDLYPEDFLSE